MKKNILTIVLAGITAVTSVSSIGISKVYANVAINNIQYVTIQESNTLNDDVNNQIFTVIVTDLDGNVIEAESRAPVVVVGLVGAIKWIFGPNSIYTVSGMVYNVIGKGTITFVKGAAANGGITYTAQVLDKIYTFTVK